MKTFNHHKMTRRSLLLAAALGLTGAYNATAASAAVEVVAAIPELGAIAKEVGGNNVTVYSIAKPNNDYHSVEPRPSDVGRIARADLVVRTGMDLDSWFDALSRAAGARNVLRGGAGYVDASAGIPKIEVPTEQITGASGDVHPEGNPHYYYDPIYAKYVARNVLRGLLRVDAKNAAEYRANYVRFNRQIDQKMAGWRSEMGPFVGRSIVTYHRAYNYFLRRFGLRQYGTLEPRPGIPPSARHINALLQRMKGDNVRAILIESIYPRRFPDLMARQLNVQYAVGPVSVGSMNAGAYFNLIDLLVDRTKQALRQ